MSRYRCLAASAGVLAVFLLGAPNAAAFEEVAGKSCVADASAPAWTLIGFDPGQIFPVPLYELQTRVITRWKVQVAPGKGPLAQQLVAFQPVGEEEDRKIGESAVETVSGGVNEFATRIPITGYHPHVGLHGPVETLYCSEQKEMLSGVVEGEFALGETRHYKVKVGVGAPVTVTVEPDRDGDGYGDLTQDKCPRLAAVHDECPFVTLRPYVAAIAKQAILLRISTGDTTQVQVSGQVAWSVRPKPKPAPHRPGRGAKVVVGLSGGTQEVGAEPGVIFTIPLPKAITRRLGKMTPKESLKAELTIVATDVAGQQTAREMSVRLKGRKVHHRKR